MALARRLTLAPLRIFDNLHCGYWSAVSPCVSSTQVGGPPRQQRQRSSATLPREKTPRTLCGNPLPPLPVGRSAGGRSGALLPVWTAAMAGPAASLPGVRFGRCRGLHQRCCPLLRLWGRLRWPGRRAPPALPGWEGRCPWYPPLAVRRRRGRCRGLHQRCHSCVPLALDLPPRWRFGPGAPGSRTACGCRGATVLLLLAREVRWNKLPLGFRWCGRGRASGCGARPAAPAPESVAGLASAALGVAVAGSGAGRSKGWNSRCHCWAAASAAVLAAVAAAGAGALRRCAATVAVAVGCCLCCCAPARQQSLDGTGHHGPRAASPGRGVPARGRAPAQRAANCGTGSDAGQRNSVGAAGAGGGQRRRHDGGTTESGNKEASTASFQQARPSKPQAPSALAFRLKSVRSRCTRSTKASRVTPRCAAISA
jgi:hypothetical protein